MLRRGASGDDGRVEPVRIDDQTYNYLAGHGSTTQHPARGPGAPGDRGSGIGDRLNPAGDGKSRWVFGGFFWIPVTKRSGGTESYGGWIPDRVRNDGGL